MNTAVTTHYAEGAYDSRHIPNQSPQIRKHAGLLTTTLPWGDTEDIAPFSFIDDYSPERLRDLEEDERKNPGIRQRNEAIFHNACNHLCYRRAHASLWTQIWLYMWGVGRALFYIGVGILLVTQLPLAIFKSTSIEEFNSHMLEMSLWILPIPLTCWVVGHIALYRLPTSWILKPSKGPLWELNRQTGQVTVFARKPGQFSHLGIDGDFVRPFYEFDACVHILPSRQGLPQYSLHLVHRYQPVAIDFKSVIGLQSSEQACFALWDMWQNYMDISHPLPEIPTWEEFRPLDPTTAEHDRLTGRNPRYWRDMDKETYKNVIDELLISIQKLDAFSRPNLMSQHVRYL
ncbi:hypothetical protein RHP75_00735 [Pseudomonas sp. SG20056]|uniref:hypothetical protein n=1 Tax=Pseudomonas sp. SG20056 TaxID=3074146 RepID=UPI00287F57DF|nr:hypothetical protein [Pseudomonas sp. SG20056]WNF46994.1 hypothetical protein RHP75_00735 [Pseudomonas sp. SG20056]